MLFAKLYRDESGSLVAVPADCAGDALAQRHGYQSPLFHGRNAPIVLVAAMLRQFGGSLHFDGKHKRYSGELAAA